VVDHDAGAAPAARELAQARRADRALEGRAHARVADVRPVARRAERDAPRGGELEREVAVLAPRAEADARNRRGALAVLRRAHQGGPTRSCERARATRPATPGCRPSPPPSPSPPSPSCSRARS